MNLAIIWAIILMQDSKITESQNVRGWKRPLWVT